MQGIGASLRSRGAADGAPIDSLRWQRGELAGAQPPVARVLHAAVSDVLRSASLAPRRLLTQHLLRALPFRSLLCCAARCWDVCLCCQWRCCAAGAAPLCCALRRRSSRISLRLLAPRQGKTMRRRSSLAFAYAWHPCHCCARRRQLRPLRYFSLLLALTPSDSVDPLMRILHQTTLTASLGRVGLDACSRTSAFTTLAAALAPDWWASFEVFLTPGLYCVQWTAIWGLRSRACRP